MKTFSRAWNPSFRGRSCWPSSSRTIPKVNADVRPSGWSGCYGSVVQQWQGLADEALEDVLYDSQILQGFAPRDLAAEGVPDAPALLKFRWRLETHGLCQGLFTASCATD